MSEQTDDGLMGSVEANHRRRPAETGWRAPGARLAVALVLLALVYLAFPNRSFYFDSISYAQQVEDHDLIHPHHLLHNVVGWLAYRSVNSLTAVRAIYVLQWVNSLGALVGLMLFYRLARRYGGSSDVALWATILLGVSHAWWKYATAGETYILPVTLVLAGVCACERCSRRLREGWRPFRALLLGLPFAAAALLHQTHVLFMAVLLVWFACRRCRWSNALTAASSFALCTFAAYLLSYAAQTGSADVGDMAEWSLGYARHPAFAGAYGLPVTWSSFPRAAWAWSGLITAERWPSVLRVLFLEGLIIGFASYWLARARRNLGEYARTVLFLAVWVAFYGTFGFWWEPGNIEFLVAAGPPLLLIAAGAHGQAARRPHPRHVWPVIGVMTIAFSFGVNFYQQIIRLHAAKGYGRTERLLLATTGPDDVVVLPGTLSNYLPYFHGRSVTGIRGVQWAGKYGVGTLREYLAGLERRIDGHLDAGRTVYTVDYPFELGPCATRRLEIRDVPVREVTRADIRDFYCRYTVEFIHHPRGVIARLTR